MSDTKVDTMVLELLKKVEEKKAQIGKAERPSWITNCSFGYNPDTNTRRNIQVETSLSELVGMHSFLVSREADFAASRKALGLTEKEAPFGWLGFTADQWISDIQTRINGLKIKAKKDELAKLEERVNALVSPEQRRAIELEKLVKEIG